MNAFATAVKYVFNTCPNWTTHLAEVEVWAMDPSSITCLHPNMTDDSPAWTVCTAPTCTENGFEERFCPDCGARFEREVPLSKLGHDFVATLTTPGSASSYGSGYVECSRCDEFHLEFNGDTDAIVIECSKDFADYINDILKTPADIGNDAGSEAR